MAAPTLEAAAASAYLRITGGTSGDPVTFNDVWEWGAGGGLGAVPIDGGGTAAVNTFLTEVVADAIYTVQKKLWFGNGTTASYFKSSNEHIYYAAGIVFDIRSAATLQLGTLTGSWGVNGSSWSLAPSVNMRLSTSQTTAGLLLYDSRLSIRTGYATQFEGGNVTLNKVVFSNSGVGGYPTFLAGLASVNIADVYSYGGDYGLLLSKSPASMSGFHAHSVTNMVFAELAGTVTATGSRASSITTRDLLTKDGVTLQMVDSLAPLGVPLMLNAADVIKERFTVNVHVNDKNGANLATATVAATSFGNIVSNDAGSTFYRCIVGHTSGTFATDLAAGKWELTTAANAALAGVTGAAGAGAWVTGVPYVAAAAQFSVSTDANGDIAVQTITSKEWRTTSEALLSFAPYTFTLSKAAYETLTLENIVPDAAIVWSCELQDPAGGGLLTHPGMSGGARG